MRKLLLYNLIYIYHKATKIMTVQYWPSQQGMELNTQISYLFKKAYLKLNSSLHNNTSDLLSIDILNGYTKKELFKIILLELEILVLDIIEVDIGLEDLQVLNQKILLDLINKSLKSFSLLVHNQINVNHAINININYLTKRFFSEHIFLLQDLLIYLIFGSSDKYQKIYFVHNIKVPIKHVEILLDNFIIQIADIVFYELMNSKKSLSILFQFLQQNQICHSAYISVRSIATFKNNLLWYNLIAYYIKYPIIIYNNRYKVWVFTRYGLYSNYLYADRANNLKSLSSLQILILILLELQDFVYPKIKNILFSLGQFSIYLLKYIINNSINLLFKSIIVVTRTKT